jgi:hypothetical protein
LLFSTKINFINDITILLIHQRSVQKEGDNRQHPQTAPS